jgi:hypothetical protein
MKSMKMMTGFILMALMAAGASATLIEIGSSADHWIREISPNTVYNDDGISVWSTSKGDRRYGLAEFDLSSLAGTTIDGVKLGLYSAVHRYSDYRTPIIQSAFVIAGPVDGMTWNSYMAGQDAGKVALQTLGAYNLPAASDDPAQQNAYMYSYASAADLALIQAAINGNGHLSLVFVADESGTYGRSWGDGDTTWAGPAPVLVIPEPMTVALLGLGGLAMLRRRQA